MKPIAVGVMILIGAGAGLSATDAEAASCCRVPSGAKVRITLSEDVGTKTQRTGDTFRFALAAPVIVGARVVLRAGAPGVGEVIEASKPGFGGKAAKLVLAADYLEVKGRHIPLQGLQLAAAGKGNVGAATAIGAAGIVLGPVGLVGMAVQGGNVAFPAGTKAEASIAESVVLAPVGRATKAELAAARATGTAVDEAGEADAIPIAPPPPGKGQIVFFRAHTLLGTAQWFNVREDGRVLGKLSNGAYFSEVVEPGEHTFTATEEPEFKDTLKLRVDPGQTYYVEGILTKGLVLSAADLTPSDRARFQGAAKGLKPAEVATAAATDAPASAAASVK